jgi:predicted porin
MKTQKNAVFAAAIITGLSAFSAAQAAPVIYGKANITVDSYEDTAGDDAIRVQNNASRLGIKGKVKLPEGMTAIYKAEFEIQFDDGDKKGEVFAQRNIYAGLKGSMGTVKVGFFDTITKKAQGKVDLFNDLDVGDIKDVLEGEDRGANTIQFESGKLADGAVKAKLALFQGEVVGGDDNGIGDGYAFGIDYSAGALNAALSYSDAAAVITDEKIIRVSAQYKTEGGTKLGAMIHKEDAADGEDGMGYVLSASVPFSDSYSFNVQYAAADEEIAKSVESQINVGVVRKISKKVKTFAYYGSNDAKGGGDGETTIGAGMEIKF